MIRRVDSEVMKAKVLTAQKTRDFITSLGADEASPNRLIESARRLASRK